MNKANECTCPSGDGSLRWPCPAHPAVEQAGGDERAAFERAFTVQEGIYFDDKRGEYRSMNLRAIEATDAQDLNLRLQGWQARAALAQPSPVRSSLLINGYQLRAALDFIAPDGTAEQLESEACIEWRQQDADFLEAGLYAFCAEYPEEGGVLLDEEPTTAQPSPLQSEQAEAERPEVVARVVHSNPVVLGQCGPLNANDELMTVAQHAASVARWAEMFNRVEQQRDAALAEVERLRESKGDPVGSFEKCMKVMYERDENAKRLEVALARVTELEGKLTDWVHEGFRLNEALAMASDAASKGDAARQAAGGMEMEIQELKAKLAEMEKQEPVVTVAKVPGEDWNSLDFHRDLQDMQPGTKLYAAPVAQAQQLNDLDKQCRDDVARALGLRPNQERGFAWSYLLASIKSCVKASEDSAQAQHSVPEVFREKFEQCMKLAFAEIAQYVSPENARDPQSRARRATALATELRAMLAAAPVCRLSRSALTEAQMRRLYENSTETENERLGFEAFARLIRRAEAVHQIAAAPGKEGV